MYSVSEEECILDPAKADSSFTWQTFACWIGEWRDECSVLRYINYFICINYWFSRNRSNFPGMEVPEWLAFLKGFIHFQLMSFLMFYKFITFDLPCLSWEGNVIWVHLNMLQPKVHELYRLVCIIKWYLHCYIHVLDFKNL